ncbi:MAG: hypothetical protein JAZ17_21115 [Candidatus Thiodiazotropha endolucinida]|nr:hypothetical protein [Candidatus Thiodiazotropha endolucinida]MCG8110881.1 hypothetical protein [Candidatus Thiodiazotropha taylori]
MTSKRKPEFKEYQDELEVIAKLPTEADIALSPHLVSLMTGKALKTLERDRAMRKGIPFTRIAFNRVTYSLRDVREFMKSHYVETH